MAHISQSRPDSGLGSQWKFLQSFSVVEAMCGSLCDASADSHDVQGYRGTSLTRNTHPHRITIGPWTWGYCRVLPGGVFLMSEVPLYLAYKKPPPPRTLH